jgi:phosphoribosylaminoimidazolecarboxamide formyltransferase/IMP cyclohydrolase
LVFAARRVSDGALGAVLMSDLVRIERALLSVSDKSGLVDFAAALRARGVDLVSTGGTAKVIAGAGLPVTDVATVTGFPEMMDGRVKTLHPRIHGGLLAMRDEASHMAAMSDHGIAPIDLLVVDLYPFEETLARRAPFDDTLEMIDVGGPAMIRGAAKNHAFVTVLVEVADYAALLEELDRHGGAASGAFRRRMAAKAFGRTATYDAAIADWLAREAEESRPVFRAFGGRLVQALRYGENPHQAAAFYRTPEARPGVATARQVQGKELSYNNIHDTDAAFEAAAEFDPARHAACVIVKHANPCGVAVAATLAEAYAKALRCDPVSAFGGVVALNRRLDAAAAREIVKIFTEVIVVPDADDEALAIVAAKKNLRLLLTGGVPDPRAGGTMVKSVAGGLLVQSRDAVAADDLGLEVVTRLGPTETELADLVFAFRVAKHVKSNTIVYAKDGATVGVGAGQMSRVDAARIAAQKAADAAAAAGEVAPRTRGAVAASDAFFPFADGLEAIVAAGATAVVQPGGSVRDDEVIAAADAAGIAMVFTGRRHFRH